MHRHTLLVSPKWWLRGITFYEHCTSVENVMTSATSGIEAMHVRSPRLQPLSGRKTTDFIVNIYEMLQCMFKNTSQVGDMTQFPLKCSRGVSAHRGSKLVFSFISRGLNLVWSSMSALTILRTSLLHPASIHLEAGGESESSAGYGETDMKNWCQKTGPLSRAVFLLRTWWWLTLMYICGLDDLHRH